MTRIGNAKGRVYHSELREQQAEGTRARILDATLVVMARGVASVSIPAVAREAGVSVPTIYRHFATKDGLLAEVYLHAVQRGGLDQFTPPRSVDELRDGVRRIFQRFDSVGDLAGVAMASPAAEEARRAGMPVRLEAYRRLADVIAPTLAKGDRERIARLLTVLIGSSALRMWRDHLGSSVEQAASDVDWVIRAAIAASKESEG